MDERTQVDGNGPESDGSFSGLLPRRIGRYTILKLLGEGGMGVVFAAYDVDLDRKVAIKLLRQGTRSSVSGPTEPSRLLREAQAMAKISHPNVLQVYEAGTHEGQVFLAIEYVEGTTLRAWWQAARRSWREILGTMIKAGEGLSAAHAAGLVHRDFKPENTMVGKDGRVRVMDFGLARPTDGLLEALRTSLPEEHGLPGALETPMTRTGALVGTPAYMALEQFAGNADARSDQFSFCVTLYEGLYGERPFVAESLEKLRRALLSGEVRPEPRPAMVPTWLRAVVIRGLAREPEQRWPSMDALLAALADDPARRRGRWAGAALGAALAAGVAGGAGFYAQQQARTCMGFEARLAGIWDEEVKARAQAAFDATGLVYAADSWRSAAGRLDDYTQQWVTARREACEATQRGEQSGELLDLRMACLDERRQHVRATAALLEAADRDVVSKASDTVAGLPGLDLCADIKALAAEQPPPEDPAVAARVVELDRQIIEARALERAGKYERGLDLAAAVVAEVAELGYEPLQVRAWLAQGKLQGAKGAYAEAEATQERAYASAVGLNMVPEAAEAASAQVFVVGHRLARHEDGRRWAKDAGPLARAVGTAEAETRFLGNLGLVAWDEGKLDQARAHLERALAIREKALGPAHLELAFPLNNLGNVTLAEGNLEQARAYHERALAIWEEALGPDHPNLAKSLNNLGNVAEAEGKLDRARAYYERALAIWEEALGPDHPNLANPLNNLGNVAEKEGKFDQARAYLERSLAVREKALGLDHPNLAIPLTNLGKVALAEGKLDQARAHYERAWILCEKALGPDHPNLAYPLTGLGETLLAMGSPADALPPLERALNLRSARAGDPVELAVTRFTLARALWDAPPGAGRSRAHELAELAAAAFAAAGERTASALAELRAWQSTHAR